MELSHYQRDIVEWATNGEGNCFVSAGPGCGKTTIIKEIAKILSSGDRILAVAFTKTIANAMKKQLPAFVDSKTVHSLGYGVMRDWLSFNVGRAKIDANKYREWNLLQSMMEDEKLYNKLRGPVQKLVGLAKNLAIMSKETFDREIIRLIDYYEVDIEADLEEDLRFWTLKVFEESMKFKINGRRKIEVAFSDMLYIPLTAVYKNEPVRWPQYDWVLVDEAQDLNLAQMKILEQLQAKRYLFVGDRKQSVFGFMGADSQAIDKIIETFNATTLPLSICYRCPRVVVAEAQTINPDLEPAPDAIEGELDKNVKRTAFRERVQEGEFVLCRTNYPLVCECLKLIREGKKAMIKGREVGNGLKGLVVKACDGVDPKITSVELMMATLMEQVAKKIEYFERNKREQKIEFLQDQLDTIEALVESVGDGTADHVIHTIEQIFVDDPREGVVFSTIHKAKGLEADTIWWLPSKCRQSKHDWQQEQEENLRFVAITRSMNRLFYVEE